MVGSPEAWTVGTVPRGEFGAEDPGVGSWCLVVPCIGSTRSPVSEAGNMTPGMSGFAGSNPSVAVCKVGGLFPCPSLLSDSGEGDLDLSERRASASLPRRFLLAVAGNHL